MTQPIQPPSRTSGISLPPRHGGGPCFNTKLRQNQGFNDLVQKKSYSFASNPSEPARKVSLEDLVTEILTPSSETPGRKESIEDIVKNGGRVALVTEDDGTGSGQSNVRDILIVQNGKFSSLRDLMDGREFFTQAEDSPFHNLPRLSSTAEEKDEGVEEEEEHSPFSNFPSMCSEVDVEEPTGAEEQGGLSRKISFQDIMSKRDYGILNPPTQPFKKGSYKPVEKRQQLVFLENLIHSALNATVKEGERTNDASASSHSRPAVYQKMNTQSQLSCKQSIVAHNTRHSDPCKQSVAAHNNSPTRSSDSNVPTRRTGNLYRNCQEFEINPFDLPLASDNTAAPSKKSNPHTRRGHTSAPTPIAPPRHHSNEERKKPSTLTMSPKLSSPNKLTMSPKLSPPNKLTMSPNLSPPNKLKKQERVVGVPRPSPLTPSDAGSSEGHSGSGHRRRTTKEIPEDSNDRSGHRNRTTKESSSHHRRTMKEGAEEISHRSGHRNRTTKESSSHHRRTMKEGDEEISHRSGDRHRTTKESSSHHRRTMKEGAEEISHRAGDRHRTTKESSSHHRRTTKESKSKSPRRRRLSPWRGAYDEQPTQVVVHDM